jgi:preprotein translocase SecE subunit
MKKKSKPDRKLSGGGKNFLEATRNYLHGVRSELKRISWPGRLVLKQLSIFVILMVVLLAIFTGIVDALFSRLVQIFLR